MAARREGRTRPVRPEDHRGALPRAQRAVVGRRRAAYRLGATARSRAQINLRILVVGLAVIDRRRRQYDLGHRAVLRSGFQLGVVAR